MERLPDLLVLDFCEWLQQSILRKAKYDSIDMWDLLFDDKYANVLERKSEEYCEQRIRQSPHCVRFTEAMNFVKCATE